MTSYPSFASKVPTPRGQTLAEFSRRGAGRAETSYPELPPEFGAVPPRPTRPTALAGWRPGMSAAEARQAVMAASLAGRPVPTPASSSQRGRAAPPPSSSRPVAARSVRFSPAADVARLKSQLQTASFDQVQQLSQQPAFAALLTAEPTMLDQLAQRFELQQPDPTILRDPLLRWREMELSYRYRYAPGQLTQSELEGSAWLNQMVRADPDGLIRLMQTESSIQPKVVLQLLMRQELTPPRLRLLTALLPRLAWTAPTPAEKKFVAQAIVYAAKIGDLAAVEALEHRTSVRWPAIKAAITAGRNQVAQTLLAGEVARLETKEFPNLWDQMAILRRDQTELPGSLRRTYDLLLEPLWEAPNPKSRKTEVVIDQLKFWLRSPDSRGSRFVAPVEQIVAKLENWLRETAKPDFDPAADWQQLVLNAVNWSLQADNAEIFEYLDRTYRSTINDEDLVDAAQHGVKIADYLESTDLHFSESTLDTVALYNAVRDNDAVRVEEILQSFDPDADLDVDAIYQQMGQLTNFAIIDLFARHFGRSISQVADSVLDAIIRKGGPLNLDLIKYLAGVRATELTAATEIQLYEMADVDTLKVIIPIFGITQIDYLNAIEHHISQGQIEAAVYLLSQRDLAANLRISVDEYNRELTIALPFAAEPLMSWAQNLTMGEYLLDEALAKGNQTLAAAIIKANFLAGGPPLRLRYATLLGLMTYQLNHDLYLYLLEQRARGRVTTPDLARASAEADRLGFIEVAGLSQLVERALAKPAARI